MRTMKHFIPLGALFTVPALPALAAEEGQGEGFMGGLAYAASDPVTFVALAVSTRAPARSQQNWKKPATCVSGLLRPSPLPNAASRMPTRKQRR